MPRPARAPDAARARMMYEAALRGGSIVPVNVSGCRFVFVFVALAVIGRGDVHSQKHVASVAPSANVGFTDISSSAGVHFRQINGASPEKHLAETIGSGGLFLDFDDDGWIDIFLSMAVRSPIGGRAAGAAPPVQEPRQRHVRDMTAVIRDSSPRATAWARARATTTMTAASTCTSRASAPTCSIATPGRGASPTSRGRLAWARRLEHELRLCRHRQATATRPVRRQLRRPDARTNPILRQRADRAAVVLPPARSSSRCRTSCTATTATGRFSDVSRRGRRRALRGNGLGVVVADYDDDSWPDVFVANDGVPNFLFHNDGARRLRGRALVPGWPSRPTARRAPAWAPTSAT